LAVFIHNLEPTSGVPKFQKLSADFEQAAVGLARMVEASKPKDLPQAVIIVSQVAQEVLFELRQLHRLAT